MSILSFVHPGILAEKKAKLIYHYYNNKRVILYYNRKIKIHHEIEDFVRGQIIQKLQIADGQDDPIKLKAMVKHWSQQMSAAVNREASS